MKPALWRKASRALFAALLTLAAPAQAQIAFRAAGAQVNGTGSNLTVGIPAGTQAGDFALLILAGRPSDGTEPAVPSGWTLRSSSLREVGSSDLKIMTFWRFLAGGGTNLVVSVPSAWQGNSAGISGQIAVWSGVSGTTPFDVADVVGNSAAAQTWTPAIITTVTAGAMVVSAVSTSDDNALALGTAQGFTARMSGGGYDTTTGGDHSVGLADKLQVSAGSVNQPTWQQPVNASDAWAGIAFALRPGPPPDTVPPTAPTGLTASVPSSTEINLSWGASTDNIGVAEYRIEECFIWQLGCINPIQIGTTTGTTFGQTVSEFTFHSYRVRAIDTSGNFSPYSNVVTVRTPDATSPTAPTSLTAIAASASQVNLAWTISADQGSGVNGYQVERCQGASCTDFAHRGYSVNTGPVFMDTGLSVVTYRYRIRAFDYAGNVSDYSNIANATTSLTADTTSPSSPTGLTVEPLVSNQLNLSWTDSTDNVGVVAYRVERCEGASCTTFSEVSAALSARYWDTGLARATTYRYRIRATDAAGNLSAFSPVVSGSTLNVADTDRPGSPSGFLALPVSSSQVDLSWKPANDNAGVAGYRVVICGLPFDGGCFGGFTEVGTTIGTTLSVTGLAPRTFRGYFVSAFDAAGNAGSSAQATSTATLDIDAPTPPGTLFATPLSRTQAKVSWAPSSDTNVVAYQLERCVNIECYRFATLASATGTSFLDSDLSAGTYYRYRVRAVNAAGGGSMYSNMASATTPYINDTIPPAAPTALTATAIGTTQIDLSWSASADDFGVTEYVVERCVGTGCSNFAEIASAVATSLSDAGLSPATTYSYRVRALDVAGNASPPSDVASASTTAPPDTAAPSAPSGLNVIALSATDISLTWTASTDDIAVTGYRIERCQGVGCATFIEIAQPLGTSFTDAGLSAATSYSYRVRAVDGAGNLSVYSAVGTVTTATLNNPPAVSITSPVANSLFLPPATITLSATATDSDGSVAKVEFFQGSTLIATVTAAPFTFQWADVTVGAYSLTAVATDNLGATTTSVPVNIGVTTELPKPVAITPDPLAASLGATAILTSALVPTPIVDGALSVTSSDAGVATVSASVSFSAGQSSVDIPVATHSLGSAMVTATGNGGSTSAAVNVSSGVPTVTSLAPSVVVLSPGSTSIVTATISSAQAGETSVLLNSSSPGVVTVPASVIIPPGKVSADLAVDAAGVGTSQIIATLNGANATSEIAVTPAPQAAVSFLPALVSIARQSTTTLTLALSSVQTTDTVVPIVLSPATGIISAPAQIILPAGRNNVKVPISGIAVGQGSVQASVNGSTASAVVNVTPQALALVSLAPASFTENVGASGRFTVTINAAQPSATVVALAVDQPSVLQAPSSVTIAAGETKAVFTATGIAPGNAVVTAGLNGGQKTAAVLVVQQPAALVSLTPNPMSLQTGATGRLTGTIDVAQGEATVVTLASETPAVAGVAPTATIAAGANSTDIPVKGVQSGASNVTASVNASNATGAVTVTTQQPAVASLAPATLRLVKGLPGTLRVALSHAPSEATAVTISSSDSTIASVPATVNVPAGELFADIPVAANGASLATITATLGGVSVAANVDITPAELASITISPQSPTLHVGENRLFTSSGTLTDGTQINLSLALPWRSSNLSVASIGASGIAFALAEGSTTISQIFTFTSFADGSSKTVIGSSVLTVKPLAPLVLAAPTATPVSGIQIAITITSSEPAPSGGLGVSLFATGTGSATFPASVVIPAGGTSATFTLTPVNVGSLTISAFAAQRIPGAITLTILEPLRVTALSPSSGPTGTLVGLTGTSFDPVPTNNQVTFQGASGAPVSAVVLTASSTLLTLAVPAAAVSGAITVSNTRGTAASPAFAVTAPGTTPLVSLAVASPVDGAAIGSDSVKVSGTLQGPLNTGVTVNGVVAAVTGNTFTASAVPLSPGANTLIATATAPDGQTVSQSISVTSSGPGSIQVVADTTQGLAPLTVNFTVTNTSANGLLSIQVDFTGSGTFSFFNPGTAISHVYTVPGTYPATFIVFDNSGASVQQTITINVQGQVQIDQILRTTWTGFTAALASRNTPQAIQYFSAQVRDKYQAAFQALDANLPAIVGSFSDLDLMTVSNGLGEYAVRRMIDGVDRVFLIYFLQNADGVWRIDAM